MRLAHEPARRVWRIQALRRRRRSVVSMKGGVGPSKTVTMGATSWGYGSNERQSPRPFFYGKKPRQALGGGHERLRWPVENGYYGRDELGVRFKRAPVSPAISVFVVVMGDDFDRTAEGS